MWVLALLLASCRHEWPEEAPPPSPTVARPDEYGPPEPVSLPTIVAICNRARCSGELAHVTALYDHKNRIRMYVHDADITRCADRPRAWFDRSGDEIAGAPRASSLVQGAPTSCPRR